eukprot:scaffold14945_cov119-Cylindrotheca_fusiformis.AAC.2
MTGAIPGNMNLRQMYYMDLGRNQFSGTLPPELGYEYVRLRHLHLDFNQFSGTVPESYIVAGDGRLMTLNLNDNQFYGAFPGNHEVYNMMYELTIHHNNFRSMEKDTCNLNVFGYGELVEFRSECSICQCGPSNAMCSVARPVMGTILDVGKIRHRIRHQVDRGSGILLNYYYNYY